MDAIITKFISQLQTPFGNIFFGFITHVGDLLIIAGMSFIFIGLLLSRMKLFEATIFAAGIFFAGLLTQFLKLLIGRERPYFVLSLREDGFSFPSGHALGAIVFYGFLLFYCLRSLRTKRIKIVFSMTLVLLIAAIGFSRVYLGVHWASDVLVGWLLGGIILFIMIRLTKSLER